VNKSQVSTEYLIILGVTLAAIIPAGYFFYSYSRTQNDDSVRSQVTQIGEQILVDAETVYGLAEGSLITQDFKYPANIRAIKIYDRSELVIEYDLGSGDTTAVFFSKLNITGAYDILGAVGDPAILQNSSLYDTEITGGKHSIKFESRGNYVYITTP